MGKAKWWFEVRVSDLSFSGKKRLEKKLVKWLRSASGNESIYLDAKQMLQDLRK